LIELCGLQAGRDVEIVYTGLRPGEKLHEELVRSSEGLTPTAVSKVLVLRPHPVNGVLLHRWLDSVAGLVDGDDELAVRLKLKELVPEYQWQLSTEPETELSTS
ncbi:MAG: polysaccharide biosynthesis protein, partial [Chloroflexi bacterium]|nr:polysaccharide biosynthesis protein [Chloroflexota bacterium]